MHTIATFTQKLSLQLSLSILKCHLGLIFWKKTMKFFWDERTENVHASHIAKISFHSLGFERESKKRGDLNRVSFLSTLVGSCGERKLSWKTIFESKFLWILFNWTYRGFLVCMERLWGTMKPILYEKEVDSIIFLKKRVSLIEVTDIVGLS
jgi:hypothetical protein